jgi:hypothetical protein
MFLDLLVHPVVEGLHPWAALALMQEQACLGGQPVVLSLLVGTEHRAQALQHEGDLLGKGLVDLDELPPSMGNTGGGLGRMGPGDVAGQGIGHLDRGLRVLALVEDLCEVFPGMAGAGLKQRDEAVDGLATTPEVNTPVRSGLAPGGNASARASAVSLRMRMVVSSL